MPSFVVAVDQLDFNRPRGRGFRTGNFEKSSIAIIILERTQNVQTSKNPHIPRR